MNHLTCHGEYSPFIFSPETKYINYEELLQKVMYSPAISLSNGKLLLENKELEAFRWKSRLTVFNYSLFNGTSKCVITCKDGERFKIWVNKEDLEQDDVKQFIIQFLNAEEFVLSNFSDIERMFGSYSPTMSTYTSSFQEEASKGFSNWLRETKLSSDEPSS